MIRSRQIYLGAHNIIVSEQASGGGSRRSGAPNFGRITWWNIAA